MLSQIKSVAKKTPLLAIARAYRQYLKNREIKKYKSADESGFYCAGCGRYWKRFKPFPPEWIDLMEKSGWKYPLEEHETLNLENYTCYGCEMTDRDRLYALYLSDVIGQEKISIVEFAPTKALSDFLRSFPNVSHRTSDLFMEGVDDKLDLQDLHRYADESFDIFICSHMLEHVDDDRRAMRELYRITKKGGLGIAMVPIVEGAAETHEDPEIKDENLRIKYFGQADHVRLYTKNDFIERLKSAGFSVKLLDVSYFGREVFEKNGITPKSVLYVVNK